MKIRTDFVTNSSSSGYVLVQLEFCDGKNLTAQREYDAGYGGDFWNYASEERLTTGLDKAQSGSDLLQVLDQNIEYFHDYEMEKALRSMQNLDGLQSIYISEDTHYDDGDAQGGSFYYLFHRHNNDNFYPEDWAEYMESVDQIVERIVDSDSEREKASAEDVAKRILKYSERYAVLMLLWCGVYYNFGNLSKKELEELSEFAGKGDVAESLRLNYWDYLLMTKDPERWVENAQALLGILLHDDHYEKCRDYVKYLIECFPSKGPLILRLYNTFLSLNIPYRPRLLLKEVNEFAFGAPCRSLEDAERLCSSDSNHVWTSYSYTKDELRSRDDSYNYHVNTKQFRGFIEQKPEISVLDQRFLFASGADNKKLEPLIQEVTDRGGIIEDRFSNKTNYCVVSKLKDYTPIVRAIRRQQNGEPVQIIWEKDLKDSLAGKDFEARAKSQLENNKVGLALIATMMAVLSNADESSMTVRERLVLEQMVISQKMQSVLGTDLRSFLLHYKEDSTKHLAECIEYLQTSAKKEDLDSLFSRIREAFTEESTEIEKLLKVIADAFRKEA